MDQGGAIEPSTGRRHSREFDALTDDIAAVVADQHRRQELLSLENAERRETIRAIQRSRDFCDQFLPFFSEFDESWENISDRDHLLGAQAPATRETQVQVPFSTHRNTELNMLGLWNFFSTDDLWNLISQPTCELLVDQKGIKPFGCRYIERAVLALLEHRVSAQHMCLDIYFTAQDEAQSPNRTETASSRRWGVPQKLFFRILSFMTVDHSKLVAHLNDRFKEFILLMGNVVLDESIIACRDTDAPTVYIPRKPHPTGLRFYLLCVKLPLCNRSYCLKIIPDLGEKKHSVNELFKICFGDMKDRRVRHRERFMLTVDAFFAINDLLLHPPTAYDFTASWNKARKREFWRVLFTGLKPKEFRVARSGIFTASVFRDNGDMAVITTGVKLTQKRTRSDTPSGVIENSSLQDSPVESETDDPEASTIFCTACHKLGSFSENGPHRLAVRCAECPNGIHLNHPQKPSPPKGFEGLGLDWCSRDCLKNWAQAKRQCLNKFLDPNSATLAESPTPTASSSRHSISKRSLVRLRSCPNFLLKELCQHFGFDFEGLSPAQMAATLGGHSIELEASEDELSHAQSASSSQPQEIQTEQDDVSEVSPEVNDEGAVWSVDKARTSFQAKSVSQLTRFVASFGVDAKAHDKDLLVDQAVLLDMPEDERIELGTRYDCFLARKGSCRSGEKPFCNQLYATHFSAVDTFDRRFYELFRSAQQKNWVTTSILGCVSYLFLNLQALTAELYLRPDVGTHWQPNTDAKTFVHAMLAMIKPRQPQLPPRMGRPTHN